MSLLHKIDSNGNVNATYNSSNILKSVYDKDKQELTVIFKGGSRYLYETVSSVDYMRFETAESQGKVLNTNIKSKPFKKLDPIDPKTAEKDVDDFKKIYVKELSNDGIDSILSLINSTDQYDSEIFNKIIKRCSDVLEMIKPYES